MPGMPGTRMMPGMPGTDDDNWEMPRTRSMPRGKGPQTLQPGGRVQPPLINKSLSVNPRLLPQGNGSLMNGKSSALLQGDGATTARPSGPTIAPAPAPSVPTMEKPQPQAPVATTSLNREELRRKTISLLEEYFSVRLLDEALQCVVELKSPSYPELVKEAISLGLEKNPPCVEPVAKLLEHLQAKNVLTSEDLGSGCLLYGSMLDDIGIDLPKAPNSLGEILGRLVLVKSLDFELVKEVLKKMEDEFFRKAVFEAVMRNVSESASGQSLLDSQVTELEACRSLL